MALRGRCAKGISNTLLAPSSIFHRQTGVNFLIHCLDICSGRAKLPEGEGRPDPVVSELAAHTEGKYHS